TIEPNPFETQSAPSGPAMIALGATSNGPLKIVTRPLVVMRPTVGPASFVNHGAPSGPTAIPSGRPIPDPANFVIAIDGIVGRTAPSSPPASDAATTTAPTPAIHHRVLITERLVRELADRAPRSPPTRIRPKGQPEQQPAPLRSSWRVSPRRAAGRA